MELKEVNEDDFGVTRLVSVDTQDYIDRHPFKSSGFRVYVREKSIIRDTKLKKWSTLETGIDRDSFSINRHPTGKYTDFSKRKQNQPLLIQRCRHQVLVSIDTSLASVYTLYEQALIFVKCQNWLRRESTNQRFHVSSAQASERAQQSKRTSWFLQKR